MRVNFKFHPRMHMRKSNFFLHFHTEITASKWSTENPEAQFHFHDTTDLKLQSEEHLVWKIICTGGLLPSASTAAWTKNKHVDFHTFTRIIYNISASQTWWIPGLMTDREMRIWASDFHTNWSGRSEMNVLLFMKNKWDASEDKGVQYRSDLR